MKNGTKNRDLARPLGLFRDAKRCERLRRPQRAVPPRNTKQEGREGTRKKPQSLVKLDTTARMEPWRKKEREKKGECAVKVRPEV